MDEDSKSTPGTEGSDNPPTGGTTQPSQSGKEEGTRIGTKTDSREVGVQQGGGESKSPDKLRDGT